MQQPGAPRVLLHAFSTFKLGGPQARFVQLANAFGPRYRHVVVAMDDCFEAGERLSGDVDWQARRMHNRRGGALANRAAFRGVLRELDPDVLFSYNWGAIEWMAGNFPRTTPQVHVEDGFGPEEAVHQLPRRVWTRRVLLGLTRTPLVVASRNLERIATQVWRQPARRVSFIANGVAIDLPARPPRPAARPLTIGTVAGLRPEKNVARLVRAFAAVRAREPAQLIVVGDGPERAALQALASDLGVSADVEFTGYLKDPHARLVEFDLFALSSNTEQLPISLLEAMACGLPVVSTRVGDVEDIVPPEAAAGLTLPDDASFEVGLLHMLACRSDWSAWGRVGQEQVRQHYSRDAMLAHWQALFDGQLDSVFARRAG